MLLLLLLAFLLLFFALCCVLVITATSLHTYEYKYTCIIFARYLYEAIGIYQTVRQAWTTHTDSVHHLLQNAKSSTHIAVNLPYRFLCIGLVTYHHHHHYHEFPAFQLPITAAGLLATPKNRKHHKSSNQFSNRN